MSQQTITKHPTKDVDLVYEMNFGFQPEIVRGGKRLVSVAVSVAVLNGGTGTVTVGSTSVTHPIAYVVLNGGTDGNSYRVTFDGTYDDGTHRALSGILEVTVG